MNDLPGTLDQLTARLETLEKRVYVLEHPSVVSQESEANATPRYETVEDRSLAQTGGLFSIVGRAMLGIAGAYVLRAVAESTPLPKLAFAAIAIAYAILWLVWAVRVKAASWVPSAIYAGTSAVILTPMLWELTLSFKVLAPSASAAILAIFVLTASALAWKHNLTPVLWVVNAMAAAAALGLAIASRQLIPFISALLLMAVICEFAAKLNHGSSVRPLVAVAADVAIWALIFIYTGPQDARVDYPVLGMAALLVPGCALFLIYAASAGAGTILHRKNITVFETFQPVIAFLLAASSVLYFEPHLGPMYLGAACLVLAAACYALALTAFSGVSATRATRNYQVFLAWGTGLLLAGSLLCLPTLGVTLCLGVSAIASVLLGIRLNRLTLQVHGLVLLVSAAVSSGLAGYVFHTLAGTLPITFTASICIAAVSTLVFYGADKPAVSETWAPRSLRVVSAALAVCAAAAFLVQGLLFLMALRMTLDVYHIAFIRTLTCCAMALSLAFSGSRWNRKELTNIAFAILAFVAAKLVFEDLRHGRFEFIAGSIFLFAISLIGVPRLARMGQKV
ncbi:MAG: hypothetical protein ABSG51_10280 [Terracidiphilus sp.]|jgi:hypothetical protein